MLSLAWVTLSSASYIGKVAAGRTLGVHCLNLYWLNLYWPGAGGIRTPSKIHLRHELLGTYPLRLCPC